MRQKLLYCTYNKAKFEEISKYIDIEKFILLSPEDLNMNIDVEETGDDYKTNAQLKVQAHLNRLEDEDIIAFSDDTGVEIAALNGEPGIHTRRWNGSRMTDEEVIEYALEKMKDKGNRAAKFITCIAYGSKSNSVQFVFGELLGSILEKEDPKTDRMEGFPFSTIFWVNELQIPLGRLHSERNLYKNFRTHREKAFQQLLDKLTSKTS